jgi:beta-galactosidase
VHVYTSGDEAELFLNGKSLGKRKKAHFEYRLRWDDVIYEPGKLVVKVWKDGREWAEESVETTMEASKIALSVDRGEINADEKDLAFVTVNIVDENELLVPKSNNYIHFEIEGEGEIIAVGNGDPNCHEPFNSNEHSAFNGKCLVIIKSTGKAGTIKLSAKSEGLLGSEVSFSAH